MKHATKTYENEKTVRVVIKDNGEVKMCLSDIVRCAGYRAPSKFVERSDVKGEKLTVVFERKPYGTTKANMNCVSFDEYLIIAKRHNFPEALTKWVKHIVSENQEIQKEEKKQDGIIYEIKNDDIEQDINMMLDMINNLTYACLGLRQEIEKQKRKIVRF